MNSFAAPDGTNAEIINLRSTNRNDMPPVGEAILVKGADGVTTQVRFKNVISTPDNPGGLTPTDLANLKKAIAPEGETVHSFIGYSGRGYKDPDLLIREVNLDLDRLLAQKLDMNPRSKEFQDMLQKARTNPDSLEAKKLKEVASTIVVSGGVTDSGIGAAYAAAKARGFKTAGIMSDAGAKYPDAYPHVDRIVLIHEPTATWGGLKADFERMLDGRRLSTDGVTRSDLNVLPSHLTDTSRAYIGVSDTVTVIGGGPVSTAEWAAFRSFAPERVRHVDAPSLAHRPKPSSETVISPQEYNAHYEILNGQYDDDLVTFLRPEKITVNDPKGNPIDVYEIPSGPLHGQTFSTLDDAEAANRRVQATLEKRHRDTAPKYPDADDEFIGVSPVPDYPPRQGAAPVSPARPPASTRQNTEITPEAMKLYREPLYDSSMGYYITDAKRKGTQRPGTEGRNFTQIREMPEFKKAYEDKVKALLSENLSPPDREVALMEFAAQWAYIPK